MRALLVKFLKTRQFDWILLKSFDLFAEIVQTVWLADPRGDNSVKVTAYCNLIVSISAEQTRLNILVFMLLQSSCRKSSLANLSDLYIQHYFQTWFATTWSPTEPKASCHPFNQEASICVLKPFLLLPPSPYFLVSLISESRQNFPRAAAGFRI